MPKLAFHPRVWLNWLLPPFTRLERMALQASMDAADEPTRALVAAQLRECTLAYRESRGRSVILYAIKAGIWFGHTTPPLPVSDRELRWARVQFRRGKEVAINCDVWVLNGHASHLHFDRSPRGVRAKDLVASVRELADLTAAPQAPAYRLPPDLQAASAQARHPDGLAFLSADETYRVTLPAGDYVVIGELPDHGTLVVSPEPHAPTCEIYFAGYGGEPLERLGDSCAAATAAFAARKRA